MTEINELELALEVGYGHGQADAAAEVSALKEKLKEAGEVIGEFYGDSDQLLDLFKGISNEDAPRHGLELDYVNLDTLRRARAFLNREKDNG